MSNKDNFNPTSKLIPYVDHSLTYKIKTPITYVFGDWKGRHAVRFYINGEVESTRFINKKKSKHFKLFRAGGQTLRSVRRQREKCLELVVHSLFERYGFKVALSPKLNQYNPDMLIQKESLTCYIELKAFHSSYLCGDKEISQAMKYYREAVKTVSNPKVILITSGTLIDSQESFLSNPKCDPVQFVSSYYKKLIIPRSQVKNLDDSARRDIYKRAANNFSRNLGEGFPSMKVIFFQRKHIQKFPSCLFSDKAYNVLLIDSNSFLKILKKEKLHKEANKFHLLSEKEQERLIINGKILKM
jgi:hypothetical protein